MSLSREALERIDDADYDQWEVPAWGTVRIRSLSANERLQLAELGSSDGLTAMELFDFYARLIALSLVDAENRLLFDADSEPDRAIIKRKNWSRLEEVGRRILRFNAMSAGDEGEGKN